MNDSKPSLISGLDPQALLAMGEDADTASVRDSWEPPTLEEVARLFPQWQTKQMLGRGGMGAVYLLHQPDLDRDVAVKLLPIEACSDERAVERFRREARTLAKLRHPGIVALFEAGVTSAGHFYFVMEHVEGQPLSEVIAAGRLDTMQAIEVVSQVCAALASAHEQGVIHRDIKPSNILLTTDGQVKVADFGLARWCDDARQGEGVTLSRTGAFMGTPAYTAPEQARDATRADHRADIYSLGVLLYEMLTGELPRGVFQPPSKKTGSDARLDNVVARALQERPEDRYQAATEMGTDVASIHTPSSGPPAAKRAKLLPALLTGSLLLILSGAVWWWQGQNNSPRPKEAGTEITQAAPPATIPAPIAPARPTEAQPEPVPAPAAPVVVALPDTSSPSTPSSPQPHVPEPPEPKLEVPPVVAAPSVPRIHVWSVEPVNPALHPPSDLLAQPWRDAFLLNEGGVVLLEDGIVARWHVAKPDKSDRVRLASPASKLELVDAGVCVTLEDGSQHLIGSAHPDSQPRLLKPEEGDALTSNQSASWLAQAKSALPPGYHSESTLLAQAGIALAYDNAGKAILWGARVPDSPQRFRLPNGVTQVRLGPTGLLAAW